MIGSHNVRIVSLLPEYFPQCGKESASIAESANMKYHPKKVVTMDNRCILHQFSIKVSLKYQNGWCKMLFCRFRKVRVTHHAFCMSAVLYCITGATPLPYA